MNRLDCAPGRHSVFMLHPLTRSPMNNESDNDATGCK